MLSTCAFSKFKLYVECTILNLATNIIILAGYEFSDYSEGNVKALSDKSVSLPAYEMVQQPLGASAAISVT